MTEAGYTDRVWRHMEKMPFRESFVIEDHVAPENRAAFVEAIKLHIDFDISQDFYLEFSNDYSKVRKFEKSKLMKSCQ